ncbi:protein Bouncer [Danio aesculapii]|uniref:protein Bouncer n=1 Tax=Danio aesculapii TaxID=1142201 RepID=UPI0024BF5ED2|nr:protein Bouncer [Danio aesculapii]
MGYVLLFLLLVCVPVVFPQGLRCLFCPVTALNGSCVPVVTECPVQELCYTADGRFGRSSVLFRKGCMLRTDCSRSRHEIIRGNNISFSFSCCGGHYCNSQPRAEPGGRLLLLLLAAAALTAAGAL